MDDCMVCRNKIAEDDLVTRRCHNVLHQRPPFFLPVVIFEPMHTSEHLCGKCAKKNGQCPCCGGELIPGEEIIAAHKLFLLGKKEVDKRGLSGRFRAVVITESSLGISCVTQNGTSNEIFWIDMEPTCLTL